MCESRGEGAGCGGAVCGGSGREIETGWGKKNRGKVRYETIGTNIIMREANFLLGSLMRYRS